MNDLPKSGPVFQAPMARQKIAQGNALGKMGNQAVMVGIGACLRYIIPFPLTPALSQKERE